KAGHTFAGWYRDKALKKIYNFNNRVTKKFTLRAKWERKRYRVTFDDLTNKTVRRVRYNSRVKQPANPVRRGFVFKGWYRDKALKKAYNFRNRVTKRITLLAKWERRRYNVTVVDGKKSSVVKVSFNRKIKALQKPGFRFIGFYTDPKFRNEFTGRVTGKMTLYARFRK
ncbi:MAG: InlB B-repeat-containing protein, partial [Oscillospiraceae bacterium]|nr:InlB B-repeat-containing protein [Oscillospiraceae bacterium]